MYVLTSGSSSSWYVCVCVCDWHRVCNHFFNFLLFIEVLINELHSTHNIYTYTYATQDICIYSLEYIYVCVCILYHICATVYIHVCVCVCVCGERERERERESINSSRYADILTDTWIYVSHQSINHPLRAAARVLLNDLNNVSQALELQGVFYLIMYIRIYYVCNM